MTDLLSTVIVLCVGLVVLYAASRRFMPWERPWLAASFGAHMTAAFAQVAITRGMYGGGDMLNYYRFGERLGSLVLHDPVRYVPDVVALLFQQQVRLPVPVVGVGSSTGSMTAVACILSILTGSLAATCLVLAVSTFLAKVVVYWALRSRLERTAWRPALFGCLLVPSAVFWTSGLLKESLAINGVALLLLGSHWFLQGNRARAAGVLGAGMVVIGLFKGYLLFPFAVGFAAWLYFERAATAGREVKVRPFYLALAAAGAVGLLLGLGHIFPRYALENVAEEAAHLQELGMGLHGGSNFNLGNATERTLGGQLAFAPMALTTSLFRPFLFEASNAQMVVNALEATLLTVGAAVALVRLRWSGLWALLARRPIMAFSLVFTLLLALGVGLTTTNLGTLSRYRAPMMPFYGAFVMLAWQVSTRRRVRPDPIRAPIASSPR